VLFDNSFSAVTLLGKKFYSSFFALTFKGFLATSLWKIHVSRMFQKLVKNGRLEYS